MSHWTDSAFELFEVGIGTSVVVHCNPADVESSLTFHWWPFLKM